MPVLPGWLGSMMPGASASAIARHVGLFSGVYAAGVLFGALLWGVLSNRVGRSRILIIGLIGYLLLADRAVEIVADRGIHQKAGSHEWDSVCKEMETAFRRPTSKAACLAACGL